MCRLPLTFAISLDPDQAQQHVTRRAWPGIKLFDSDAIPERNFEKVKFLEEKKIRIKSLNAWKKPSRQRVYIILEYVNSFGKCLI